MFRVTVNLVTRGNHREILANLLTPITREGNSIPFFPAFLENIWALYKGDKHLLGGDGVVTNVLIMNRLLALQHPLFESVRGPTRKAPNDGQEPKNKNIQVHDYFVVQH